LYVQARQENLMQILNVVERTIPVRSALQVVQGILLEAREDQLCFKSTNLEMSVEAFCDNVQVHEGGKVVLAKKFTDVIKQLPDSSVEIKVDLENLRTDITSGEAHFTLYGMDFEEYPRFTDEETWRDWNQLNFLSGEFSEIIRKVIFAVSQDEGKPPFRGVLMEFDGREFLQCTASDTYRLARIQKKMQSQPAVDLFRLLIPGRSLADVMRVLDGTDQGQVSCYFSESEMVIAYGKFRFFSRLLEDRYPNLDNVFPASFQTRIRVHNDLLEKTVQRAALLAHGHNQMISLQIENSVLEVKAGSEIGRMDEKLQLEHKEGRDLGEILLNARFLLDPLRIIDGEFLNIEFNGPHGPCILQGDSDGESGNYRYLVLPIKTENKDA